MTKHTKVSNGVMEALMVAITISLTAIVAPEVKASEFGGQIISLIFDQGQTGLARVGVEVGPHNAPCGSGQPARFYAFENADSGIGALWSATVVTALTQGREVFIRGTGQCDAFNVEGVSVIQLRR